MNRWHKWRALSWGDRRLLMRAAVMLVRSRWTLSRTEFRPEPVEPVAPRSVPEALERAESIARLVAMAAAGSPVRVACLHRAVVLWSLLRREGIPCRLRLGAGDLRAAPFEAHAWVECAGVALNEEEAHLARYRPFGVAVVPVYGRVSPHARAGRVS
jgi:hypothetical protein